MANPGVEPSGVRAGSSANRGDVLRAVQQYQIARMRSTHEALFQSPVYRPLCEFFVTDLYGPREVGSSRGAALHSLVVALRPVLPAWIYEGSLGLVDLHSLSERLDDRLVRLLASRGAPTPLSTADFESAYFGCDDYEDRLRQIALSDAATRFGHALARHPSAVRLLGGARRLRGLPRLDPLLAMLERGSRGFQQALDIDPFVEAMRAGETGYLNGVYARQRG
jgi:hypothetical protein